jgi:hypothetical protein
MATLFASIEIAENPLGGGLICSFPIESVIFDFYTSSLTACLIQFLKCYVFFIICFIIRDSLIIIYLFQYLYKILNKTSDQI